MWPSHRCHGRPLCEPFGGSPLLTGYSPVSSVAGCSVGNQLLFASGTLRARSGCPAFARAVPSAWNAFSTVSAKEVGVLLSLSSSTTSSLEAFSHSCLSPTPKQSLQCLCYCSNLIDHSPHTHAGLWAPRGAGTVAYSFWSLVPSQCQVCSR